MTQPLGRQIAVRVPPDLLEALKTDAEENGRTLAQTVRFLLRRQLHVTPPPLVASDE